MNPQRPRILTEPLYSAWAHMRSRVNHGKTYKNISICKAWEEYDNFFNDMMPTYVQGLTLDRIDNDGNYEPTNCRWATKRQQAENRSTTRLFSYNGKSQTLIRWAEELHIKQSTLAMRYYKYNWTIEKIFTTPTRKRITF